MIFEQLPTTKGARNWICVPDYKKNDTYGIELLLNNTGTISNPIPVNVTDSGIDMLAYCDHAQSIKITAVMALASYFVSLY